jgi:hypothetical protein
MTLKSRLIRSLPRCSHPSTDPAPGGDRPSRRHWRAGLQSLAVGLMLLAPLPAFAVDYLSAVDDLPLATGLTEQKDKTTVFDAPVGKLITAYATGNLKPADVVEFYDSTLPQLGWQKTASGTYHRKAQTLKIDVLGGQGGGPVNVSFTVSSEGK